MSVEALDGQDRDDEANGEADPPGPGSHDGVIDPRLGRPAALSRVETINLVFPQDANPKGTIFGGRVLQWVDMVGAMAAQRHCRRIVVTAFMDAVAFRAPIYVGEYAVAQAWVNRAWRTSMEVQVRVEAEAPLTGERRLSVEAFLTFVAVDKGDRPAPVPPIIPETEGELARYEAAEKRRAARMAYRLP